MDQPNPMDRAIEAARSVRSLTSPNPWVGCVIEAPNGTTYAGATEAPGGRHAEVVALDLAGPAADGATAWVTLEPCDHTGRTGPCTEALIASGVKRVVIGVRDPDPLVAGKGIARLRAAGIAVEVGLRGTEITELLAPYLHHRVTGRPWVLLKLAATLDGVTAAPDGTSQWITGEAARRDAHVLRAESDAIVVGAGTVRADDPALTVRHVTGRDPRRIVLGRAPDNAKVQPAEEHHGDLDDLLDRLGAEGVLQVMVEGGASVAHSFHGQGLVNQYVLYLAPALFGGSDGRGLFAGAGASTISALTRGRFQRVQTLGQDLRIDLLTDHPSDPSAQPGAT